MHLRSARLGIASWLVSSLPLFGQSTPAPASQWHPAEGTVVLHDFKFGTGETLPELKLHYITLGTPHRNAAGQVDNAVLLLHGTGGNAHSLMNPVFSDVLFVPGGVLDIQKYFLILPDDIGHGQSSKPSDGLHMHFPAYDYDDMVRSQKMMLDEMKIDHLRLRPFHRGQVERCCTWIGGIGAVEVKVLIATTVLLKEDVSAVTRPCEIHDSTCRVMGDCFRRCEVIPRIAYPNIEAVILRRKKGQALSVGRDRRAADLRIVEEVLERYQRRAGFCLRKQQMPGTQAAKQQGCRGDYFHLAKVFS